MAKVIPVEFPAILDRFFHQCCCITSPQKGVGVAGGGWRSGQEIGYKMDENDK